MARKKVKKLVSKKDEIGTRAGSVSHDEMGMALKVFARTSKSKQGEKSKKKRGVERGEFKGGGGTKRDIGKKKQVLV